MDRRAGTRERLGVGALHAAYQADRLSPGELVEEVDRRIAARGADSTWIARVPLDGLHERAAQLQGQRAERDGDIETLPLYGIPFAVKDNIDVVGLPTTAGCPDFATLPQTAATVVRRLLDAGAMLVGKTNLDQFATGLTGARSPYGACESVFGNRLIAGGSSSGSAVAVAAGAVAFALGTDTAGSGRVPAALNGIVGLKPTRGIVSTAGVVPACRSLDCVSILAGGVADAVAVLAVAAAPDPADPWSRPVPADRGARPPGDVRLGVVDLAALEFFGDGAMREAYGSAERRLAELVAEVRPIDLDPLLEAGNLLYAGPWVAERLVVFDEFLRTHPSSVLPVTRQVLESGRGFSAVDAFRARHRLQELRAHTARLFERVDAVALPTIGTTFTIEQVEQEPLVRNTMLGRYTQFANLLDLSAITVPAGRTSDGRPASLSLLGPAYADPTLAELAGVLATEFAETADAP